MSRGRSIVGGGWANREVKGAFKLEGLEEITDNMAAVIDEASGKQAKEVFLKAGMVLRNQARSRVKVKTGKLKEAIFAARGDANKPNVLVGVNYKIAPHAHLVEYGTVRAPAHPYLRPALSASAAEMRDVIEKGLRRIIEDKASGGN